MTAAPPSLPAVVVCGPPAAGKSTLGRELARRLGACVLDQDVLTEPLSSVVSALLGFADPDAPEFAEVTRAARYETLLRGAEDNLAVGRPVVLVAPFTTERRDTASWASLRDRLARAGGTTTLVWVHLDGPELLRRMAVRGAPRDAPKLADGAAYLARLDLAAPLVEHVAVEATTGLSEQCDAALRRLS